MNHWAPYRPTTAEPWNFQRVWMLHRRTGFGGTWNELQRDLADGPTKAVKRILEGKSRTDGVPADFVEKQKLIGDAAIRSGRSERLAAWWIYQMYFSPDPLREQLTVMWHNHFATSNAKVNNLVAMRDQNEVFRRHALDDFKSLLTATLKHPAMLRWLDGDSNRAGNTNENLGRETLELFTLGVGNYTEDDVKNVSRALTGWSVDQSEFRMRDQWHDPSEKQILGQRGKFNGDDVLDMTTRHKATAKRLAWRLCHQFLSESVIHREMIEQLADVLSHHQLNMRAGVETLLGSQLFFSNANLGRRIVDPEPFVVGTARALECFHPPASTIALGDWLEQLGRKLFYPPNVGGWPGGKSWLNSRTTIARANFGVALAGGHLNSSRQKPDLVALAAKHLHSSQLIEIAAFYFDLLTGTHQREQVKELAKKATQKSAHIQTQVQNVVSWILAGPSAQLC